MKRCVIVAGAPINDPVRIKNMLREDDYFIYCDSGLYHKEKLGKAPDLIIGDFDSYHKIPDHENVIVLPHEKDDTDSIYAVKKGISMGFEDFLLVGAIGGRFDHSMGNISALLMLDSIGKKGVIIDDYSEIQVISGEPAYIKDTYSYFSLLAAGGPAAGICCDNAAYPLYDAVLTPDYALGISNEVIPGKTAKVSLRSGRLLLIKVF